MRRLLRRLFGIKRRIEPGGPRGGGSAGVREPRRPSPVPPELTTTAD